MRQRFFSATLLPTVVLLLAAGFAPGQAFRPPSTMTIVPYPTVYGGQVYTGYTGYSPTYANSAYNSLVPTYPPSINYPAFYNPVYNAAIPNGVGLNYPLAVTSTAQGLNYTATATAPVVSPSYATPAYYYGSTFSTVAPTTTLADTTYPAVVNTFAYAPTVSTWTSSPQTFQLSPSSRNDDRRSVRATVRGERRRDRSRPGTTAFIDVRVPASAELWFQGVKSRKQGTMRRFVSPRLASGRAYAYDLKVRWRVNGKRITRQRRVTVRAGDWVRLDLSTPSSRFMSTTHQLVAR